MSPTILPMAALLALLAGLPAAAAAAVGAEIADMSIEELANIQITSVSKQPEPLSGAAASVFVITADDIRRSGASSLPDVLRLAPNLQVAQLNSGGFGISARGMNGSTSVAPNKLQVLIDGRSVYTPLFSGVFWESQDLMLDDIERIEVISGPGGVLWGANAVNGVINITTRAAAASAGTLAVLTAGQRGVEAGFRQGGAMAGGHWRVYGKHMDLRHTDTAAGSAIDDARQRSQLGFRADWQRGVHQFSVNGNAYRGRAEQAKPGLLQTGVPVVLGDVLTRGVNLTGRWSTPLDGGGELSAQAYFDRSKRSVPPMFSEALDIADVQFQHALAPIGAHKVVWGANYRYTWDELTNSVYVAFLPAKTNQAWASLFAQDEIALRDTLRLVAGARIEHNPYTGNEFLPTLRLVWTAAPAHSVWLAASRTVRAPSRIDVDVFIPAAPPQILRGGPLVRSEVAKVLELGYRGQPSPRLSYSMALFFNRYDHLRTQEVAPTLDHLTFASLMEGKARGMEMWGSFQATPGWRLSAGMTALHEDAWLKAGSNDAAAPGLVGKNPAHTLHLRSALSLADDKDLDVTLRKVAALATPAVPGYVALDARFGWRLRKGVELSLIGQNLNGGHAEYGALPIRTEAARALAVKLVWNN